MTNDEFRQAAQAIKHKAAYTGNFQFCLIDALLLLAEVQQSNESKVSQAENALLISALRQCWDFIDGIADGAPDAGTNPRRANNLWAVVKDALKKAGERTDRHD